jgi:diguanylate cyclase (GGDEF)-like protein
VLELQILVATIAFVAFLISATIAERRSAEQALVELATHDFLTGLANRRRFVERLDQVAARRDRSAEGAAVVYFDLDGFKQINDTHGHAVGDAVLVEVGRRLAAVVRESDFVARIGGDEFVALLEPVADIRDADTFARRIATAIGRPCEVGGVSIPIGVATGSALVGSDSGQSLARADVRLYRNKRVRASRPAARAQE